MSSDDPSKHPFVDPGALPAHSQAVTSTCSGGSMSMRSPSITLSGLHDLVRRGGPAARTAIDPLRRVDARSAGARCRHAWNAASRSDVENDVAAAYGAAKASVRTRVADHRRWT